MYWSIFIILHLIHFWVSKNLCSRFLLTFQVVAIPELCDSEHKEILYFEFHKSQIISSLVYIIFLFVNKTLFIISVLGLLDHLWLLVIGFTGGLVIKNLHTNAGETGDSGSIPGLERSPGGGNVNPLQYCCLGNMDRGAWLVTANGVSVRHDWARMHRTTVQSWSCTPEQQELRNNQCLSIIMFLLRKNSCFS